MMIPAGVITTMTVSIITSGARVSIIIWVTRVTRAIVDRTGETRAMKISGAPETRAVSGRATRETNGIAETAVVSGTRDTSTPGTRDMAAASGTLVARAINGIQEARAGNSVMVARAINGIQVARAGNSVMEASTVTAASLEMPASMARVMGA